MIQREGKRHAQPVETGRELDRLAGRRRRGNGIGEDGWQRGVHRGRTVCWTASPEGALCDAASSRNRVAVSSLTGDRLCYVGPLRESGLVFPAMPSRSDSITYSISDLAREFALTTRAIRFYEDE